MLWIALHLPHLPLQALPWSQAERAALPVAVAEQHRLLGVNRAAQARGVRAGQSTATALALLSGLIVLPRDPQREAEQIERLALALAVLTPSVSCMPSGVLLEVRASLRLFGGIRKLLRRARAIAHDCGLQARIACAPVASAAWLLATGIGRRRRTLQAGSAARRLDALPAESLQALLPLAPRQAALIEALGVQRLGELRALPRAGLQRRFGRELGSALDRAYGMAPDPRVWFEPPAQFEMRRELLQRADTADVLVAAVDALLPSLRGWLHLHWRAATVLVLRLCHEHGRRDRDHAPDTVLWLQLSAPSRDAAQLAMLWRERLQRHALVAPVYAIVLVLEASVPHAGQPGELLPQPGQADGEHAALLDRLAARLGPHRVQRWQPLADHRPEQAQQAVAVNAPLPYRPAGAGVPTPPLPRPAWLLPTPQPLASDALGRPLDDGTPLVLRSQAERIESGWFDDGPVRRDYHVAEGSDHRLRWIYREHHPRPGHDGGWFLHGWFG